MKPKILLSILFVLNNLISFAQWSVSPSVNNNILSNSYLQSKQHEVPDGAGGAIVTWQDYQGGSYNIYAQRISSAGTLLWGAGVAICTAINWQWKPHIASDGSGGAIITWEDYRNSTTNGSNNLDVYAQRVNASGVVQWVANGVAVCTNTSQQYNPLIVSDGAGGAIAVWEDRRNSNYSIYTQRINPLGVPQWTANGISISTGVAGQYVSDVIPDGSNGAIVAWDDYRNQSSSGVSSAYAQKVNGAGLVQWTLNGVLVCNNGDNYPVLVSDGSGGAIITWFYNDIYAQKINSVGAVQWANNGVPVCVQPNGQSYPSICSDGNGGAIISWADSRANLYYEDIYAQRINSSGAPQWAVNGVLVCDATGSQKTTKTISDGAGGATIVWKDLRNNSNYDIYTQRINSSGLAQWTSNGVATCTASSNQELPNLVAAGNGAVIAFWDDHRSGGDEVFAQYICSAGILGICNIPEINVKGNNLSIVNNDLIPSLLDFTNFDTVTQYTSRTRTFTIENLGSGNLVISSIILSGPDNAMFSLGDIPTNIAAGSSANFTVSFTPTALGQKNATVTIVSNDADESNYIFAIRGSGICIAADTPVITASSTNNCGVLNTTLSITSGNLNGASRWIWYANSCGGTLIDSGTSIVVMPASTSSYYVRAEGGCLLPVSCNSNITVNVNPCTLTLNLKLYVQGYYESAGLMKPALYNQGFIANTNISDVIFVELRKAIPPYEMVANSSPFLNTDGSCTTTFQVLTGFYYIVIKHRNSIETWSADPVLFTTLTVNYDFSTAANKAYGNNMVEAGLGVWAFYTGELNNDSNIDLLDASLLESDINNFYFGYYATDLNGDGNVDLLDTSVFEMNVNDFIYSHHP